MFFVIFAVISSGIFVIVNGDAVDENIYFPRRICIFLSVMSIPTGCAEYAFLVLAVS